ERFEWNGREHAGRELLARERGVGDGRLLGVRERRAEGAAAPVAERATGVQRGIVAVLRDDGAELEEERRFVVPEADQVEEQLRVGGADDLLVVVGTLAPQRPGTETRRASAPEHRDQARDQPSAESTGGTHRTELPVSPQLFAARVAELPQR